MGCSFCQGHAHQTCGRPGCEDENVPELRESMRLSNRWQRMPNSIACTACYKQAAVYFDGNGHYRCATCPRDV